MPDHPVAPVLVLLLQKRGQQHCRERWGRAPLSMSVGRGIGSAIGLLPSRSSPLRPPDRLPLVRVACRGEGSTRRNASTRRRHRRSRPGRQRSSSTPATARTRLRKSIRSGRCRSAGSRLFQNVRPTLPPSREGMGNPSNPSTARSQRSISSPTIAAASPGSLVPTRVRVTCTAREASASGRAAPASAS
jgi:hypothetical protein